MKDGILMKVAETAYVKEYEELDDLVHKIPAIASLNHLSDKDDGFTATLILKDGTTITLDVIVLNRAYPSIINEVISKHKRPGPSDAVYLMIMAPYISEESATYCTAANIGYQDLSGNCRLSIGCLFVHIQGHTNKFIKKRTAKTIFDPSAKVSSLILREIMGDITHQWKLSYLSEKLGCSIGQVSKVKDYLCEQLWAEMTKDGLRIMDPKAIMQAWSKAYSLASSSFEVLGCYTLLPIAEFEGRVAQITEISSFECYLTGHAGGVRYAPVVRYTKTHLLIRKRDLQSFLAVSPCKVVDSGANVQVRVLPSDEMLHGTRVIRGDRVASPVQVYLDCINLKGRGEEMAEAVYAKEIAR